MPTTKKITCYTFAELSEEAKTRVRDRYRENYPDYDWWDWTYDRAKEVGSLIGIDIDDISFSGFWSQGDGASFTGKYSYEKGSKQAIRAEAPTDTGLHNIADRLAEVQHKHFYKLTATITRPAGRYYHENSVDIDVEIDGDPYRNIRRSAENAIQECLREFMRWIYKRLEAEYDYLTSDEKIDQCLSEGDTEYEANGEEV